ncbi:tryptophan synthase beta subunit-like PLP-dependent enzyme [Leucogyrophana mollusca]|uniref:Tryptophan synthase beta subunit-like PLP-dependent enzyme n=1 Tax=Leucogyrophana mollusca TaxID=85980 RepID=A0ACB8C059_9AGAM|nr:tryptophan synthase beta subunit-like PLP-dependent enzyme [Leucogyrophana mollusca]
MSSEGSCIAPLWVETPLIYSHYISDYLGCSAYLKLENIQTAQSFKYRGISYFIQNVKKKYGPSVRLLAASGGNAGFAAAVAARALDLDCTIYLPSIASEGVRQLLRKQGAKVIVAGDVYSETVLALKQALRDDPNAVLVPAYEDPELWEGHGSMIKEIMAQLGKKPDAIFCNVGGGGLLGGIMVGCQAVGWGDGECLTRAALVGLGMNQITLVPVVALETHGSNCFYHSISLNTNGFTAKPPTQPLEQPEGAPYDVKTDPEHNVAIAYMHKLTSRASSLGATSPAAGVVRKALDRSGGIRCVCISDEMAMWTAKAFGEDHKFLIELACAATLAAGYNRELFSHILAAGKPWETSPTASAVQQEKPKTVVFIVCGGIKVSFDDLGEHQELVQASAQLEDGWPITCNGVTFSVPK